MEVKTREIELSKIHPKHWNKASNFKWNKYCCISLRRYMSQPVVSIYLVPCRTQPGHMYKRPILSSLDVSLLITTLTINWHHSHPSYVNPSWTAAVDTLFFFLLQSHSQQFERKKCPPKIKKAKVTKFKVYVIFSCFSMHEMILNPN